MYGRDPGVSTYYKDESDQPDNSKSQNTETDNGQSTGVLFIIFAVLIIASLIFGIYILYHIIADNFETITNFIISLFVAGICLGVAGWIITIPGILWRKIRKPLKNGE